MRATPTAMGGPTAVGAAINHAVGLLLDYGGEMGRAVIDVSGDGPTNDGPSSSVARDRAVALGATINGLPIANPSEPDTVRHYREEVIGGPGAFLIEARGMQDFGGALRQKLILELRLARPVTNSIRGCAMTGKHISNEKKQEIADLLSEGLTIAAVEAKTGARSRQSARSAINSKSRQRAKTGVSMFRPSSRFATPGPLTQTAMSARKA
jgi:hypothetical protein